MRKVGSKGLFFPQKKTEELLKALHEHEMQLLKKDKVLSLLDQLDAGLQSKRPPTFPVHTTLQGLSIPQDWRDPERDIFFPKSLKRKFHFKAKRRMQAYGINV